MFKIENYSLQLKAADKIQIVNVEYQHDEDNDISIAKVFLDNETIEISDCDTEMIFRKLSELLKNKYEIYSCFTCRYGHFCPYGDCDNEIFCVNDFDPKCKNDLLPIMQNSEELSLRLRTLFDICDKHKPCSADYWTYK